MNFKTISIALFLVIGTCTTIFSQGVKFEKSSILEAFEKAERSGKSVFVDVYTVWCGPCKKMVKQVFPLKEVGEFFNQNFINLKVDAESEEGKIFAKKYKVKGYPTLLFLDVEGEIRHRIIGGVSAEDLIKEGKIAIGGESLFSMKKQYEDGNRGMAFILKYLNALATAGENNQEAEDWIFANTPKEKLLNEYIFDLIYSLSNNVDGGAYKALVKYKDEFIKIKGLEKVDLAIETVQARHIYTHIESLEQFEQHLNRVKEINMDIARVIGSAGYLYLKEHKKGLLLALGDGMISENHQVNYSMRSTFMKHWKKLDEKELKYYMPLMLELAMYMSDKSISDLDNYAEILYISKDVKNATKIASKVLVDASKDKVKGLWSFEYLNNIE